jgi:uncharacterized membrane protein YraQ (UPF0718 family)
MKMASIDKAYIEYKALVNELKNDDSVSKESLYEQLMTKESNVLGLIGRIATEKNTKIFEDSIFFNKSLYEILMLFANTWKLIIHEVFIEKKHLPTYWIDIFYSGDRKIYTGMMLVFMAVLMLCVNASAGA